MGSLQLMPADIIEWLDKNIYWKRYFEALANPSNWTQLYFGGYSAVGQKSPAATIFKTKEDIVSYFLKRIPSNFWFDAETVSLWIIYNLLNLNIINKFILAAKDLTLVGDPEVYNIGALGPKYQTGWCIWDSDRARLGVSFVFWGKGDGTKETLNKNRIKCEILLDNHDEFSRRYTKTLQDISQADFSAHCILQKGWDQFSRVTIDTTWKNILTDIKYKVKVKK